MSSEMRKLLEAVEQLNEEWVEYRDPAGHFQVVYQPPRGYFVVTQRHLPDISGESFDDVEDAIEHAHDSLGVDYLDDDVNEDFAEQPLPYDEFHMGSILDREEAPAIPLRIKALDDVPMLYMAKGDEMWLKPTNVMGEVYSEENGLTYDWDHIFHMYQRGMLEIIPDENEFNEPGEMEPYVEKIEEGFAEYSPEAALFAAGFEAGYESPAYTEDLIKQAFYDFAGGDAKYTMQEGRQAEKIEEAEGDVDQVFANLQRELTSVAMKAQQAASFIKRMHPEEREKYNLAVDLEMELDQLRKRVFDAR